jgi:hypothetical protein
MEPDSVESLINEKTRAIIYVHYAGNSHNYDIINKIALDNSIPLIEDVLMHLAVNTLIIIMLVHPIIFVVLVYMQQRILRQGKEDL